MPIRLIVSVTLAALVTAALIGPHVLALVGRFDLRRRIPVWWHRAILRLLRIKVRIEGAPADARPLLLVANHVSWKDIIVLGAITELSFIAKSEVRDWPVFGWLARLQRTVFVARDRKQTSGLQVRAIAERLSDHDVMVLFAEGTTGDGLRLLPFKSSLIGAAQAAATASEDGFATLQPVALSYTHHHGLLLGRANRLRHAWIGDLDLVPHLVERITGPRLTASVRFGEPLVIDASSNRKTVTRDLERTISALLRAGADEKPPAQHRNPDPTDDP